MVAISNRARSRILPITAGLAPLLTPLITCLAAPAAAPAQTCRAWMQRSPAAPLPSPRAEYGMAWDSTRNRTVLFGGAANLTFTAVNKELWEWDGQHWQQLPFTGGPVQRCDQVQAYDADRDALVIFGGFNGSLLADTWECDGLEWTPHPSGPGARADAFMVFDSTRHAMVMFGGLAPGSTTWGDTWHRANGIWSQQFPPTSPSPRWIARMAFDSARALTVLYGGVNGSLSSDTWEWNGTAWVDHGPGAPGPRYGHAMAYDPDRAVTVLFGGQNAFAFGAGLLADTWEWNGAAWTQVQTPGPPARSFVKMVYDTARKRLVLFGGYAASGFSNQTWEYGVYADCNTDGARTVADFGCFQSAFVLSNLYADCNHDGQLTVADFGCFQTAYVVSCS